MLPVDYVSKAVVYLSRQDTALGKVFHLANSRAVSWRELATWIRHLATQCSRFHMTSGGQG